MLVPNLLPRAQTVPPTVLSEREHLILQHEEALKRQELEARELEFERKTQAFKLQNLQSQAHSFQTGPQAESSDRGDSEIRSTAPSKRSSWSDTSQEWAPLKSKCAHSQTASHRSLSPPEGAEHKGSMLPTLSTLPRLLSRRTPVLDLTRTGQCKLKI